VHRVLVAHAAAHEQQPVAEREAVEERDQGDDHLGGEQEVPEQCTHDRRHRGDQADALPDREHGVGRHVGGRPAEPDEAALQVVLLGGEALARARGSSTVTVLLV
jgi:hypothetical protein